MKRRGRTIISQGHLLGRVNTQHGHAHARVRRIRTDTVSVANVGVHIYAVDGEDLANARTGGPFRVGRERVVDRVAVVIPMQRLVEGVEIRVHESLWLPARPFDPPYSPGQRCHRRPC